MNPPSQTLVIRADASVAIGAGHVMRCIALGQAWRQSGGRVRFVSTELPDKLRDRLRFEHFELSQIHTEAGSQDDAAQTCRLATAAEADWIVIDGYRFVKSYQTALKSSGRQVLAIDDYAHLDGYVSNLLLNQNVFAEERLYRHRSANTKLLLGSRFVLLRQEFIPSRTKTRRIKSTARNVLVTLGGSDPDNATSKVLQALSHIDQMRLSVIVVVGPGNPHFEMLLEQASELSHGVEIVCNAPNMPELMEWADIAISAGGSTCWEMACLGLPHLVMVLAENQEPIAEALARDDPGVNLGWFHQCPVSRIANRIESLARDQERRTRLSQRGKRMVDGLGASRVAQVMWRHSTS